MLMEVLTAEGSKVFKAKCSKCHGKTGWSQGYGDDAAQNFEGNMQICQLKKQRFKLRGVEHICQNLNNYLTTKLPLLQITFETHLATSLVLQMCMKSTNPAGKTSN